MPESTIRLTLAYDGSCFAGWQVQASHRTVQGTLQAALEDLHGAPVPLVGAGRTDAGVHATGQVASFRTGLAIPAARLADALNARLPRDVRILSSRVAPDAFDARRSARERTYRYYLYPARVGLPHLRHFCWRIPRVPDVQRLNALCAPLLGEWDFATFTATGGSEKSTVRRVTRAGFHPSGQFLVFEISANAFLRKMVRSVLGTLLALEAEGADGAAMSGVIESRERSRAGATAPARGLFLESVSYDEP
jgi:tRNA pseudouridine38-40 synthase